MFLASSHVRRRHDSTVEFSRVGVVGVNWPLVIVGDKDRHKQYRRWQCLLAAVQRNGRQKSSRINGSTSQS